MVFSEEYIENMTCFQTAFVPICVENDLNPLLMSLWGWSFRYEDTEKIYDGLKIDYSIEPNLFFEKYMNLQIEDVVRKNEVLDIIVKHLKEKHARIVMGIDAFYCPWVHSFLRFHVDHFFMIKSVDLVNKKFICIDWFVDKNKEFEFNISDAIDKMKAIKIVTIGQEGENEDALAELGRGYKNPECIEEDYNNFAKRLKMIGSFEDLFESDDMNCCNIFVFLKNCRDYRFCICEYLKQQEGAEFEEIISGFQQLTNLWNQLKFSMIRLFMRKILKEKTINNISKLIMEIGKNEKSMYYKIKQIV